MRLSDLLDWPRVLLPNDPAKPVSVSLTTGAQREGVARDQLLRLLSRYDLRKWQFTNRVRMQHGVISHSHPVLTLNTRYLDDDALALSTYLHEQLHWYVWRHRNAKSTLAELRRRYPSPPVAPPEGAGDVRSSYLHYLVCYLEYAALIEVLGVEGARRVIAFRCTDYYTGIYKAVLRDFDVIGEIATRHGLNP